MNNLNLNDLILKVDSIIKNHKYPIYSFEPLRIRFNISTPIMLSYPYIFLDGLIAHIQAREILKEYFDLLPQQVPLYFIDTIRLPIKKTNINIDYIYHASVSIFENSVTSTNTIYKQFSGDLVNKYTEGIKKKNVDLVRGKFKLYQMQMPINNSKWVDFYCNGDKNELERLCGYMSNIGKKRSIGYGTITSFEIEKTDRDYSIIKDNRIMRSIPLEFCDIFNIKIQDQAISAVMNYKPPYWDKSRPKLCLIPEV